MYCVRGGTDAGYGCDGGKGGGESVESKNLVYSIQGRGIEDDGKKECTWPPGKDGNGDTVMGDTMFLTNRLV